MAKKEKYILKIAVWITTTTFLKTVFFSNKQESKDQEQISLESLITKLSNSNSSRINLEIDKIWISKNQKEFL